MRELSLREMQLAEFGIMVEFDKFCKENNLIYSLAGGTLLGAVRHKGFIPWDDDIDVCMPRPDYERLFRLVSERGGYVADKLKLASDRGPNATLPFLKVLDERIIIETDIGEAFGNLWIDVFPVDGYPENDKKAEKFWRQVRFYRRIVYYNYGTSAQFKGLKKFVRKLFSVFAKAYGCKRAIGKIKRLIDKYPYECSPYIGVVSWGIYGIKERIAPDSFTKIVEVEFEGNKFSAIANWHDYLSGIYGDYIQLPPENKRYTHHIKAYFKED